MNKFYLGATALVTLAVLAASSSVAMAKGTDDNPAVVVIDQSGSSNDVDAYITNDEFSSVPVTIQGNVVTTQRVPIAESGTWQGAGLHIPTMILHDLIFYIEADNGNQVCSFTMSFVIDQTTQRRLYTRTLTVDESVEFHYEAGIDTSHLRFGTVGSGTACEVNWAAMGFAVE